MKKSQISFKIKNEKNYDSIRFAGGSLSLKDLKNKIKEKLQDKNTGPSKDKDKDKNKDDILVYDELTKQLITDETYMIASDKKVVIERVSLSQPPAPYRSQPPVATRPISVPPRNDVSKPEFICKLCKLQFTNPTLTRCCYETACESCLDKSIKQKSECPFCKKKALNSIKAGPNVKIQEMIQKLSMQPKLVAPPPQVNPYQTPGYPQTNTMSDLKQTPFREIEKYLVPGTKYFIIKSSNFENLELSIKHSEWATTKNNETKLNNAFSRSKNVILIFSVNKSSQFQGYARMESPSSNKMNSWQGQENIRLGGTFKVAWLRVCNVNFARVSTLKNRFNNHEPIKKSRDTQEIPEEIGLEICKMFEVPDKDNNYYPISDNQRKYLNFYKMDQINPPYPASPGAMHLNEPISDSVEHSEMKTPTHKSMADDENQSERGIFEPFEEKKKEEERVDLLADLDFDDEPICFNTEAENNTEQKEEKEEVMEEINDKEDQRLEKLTEDHFTDHPLTPQDQALESTDQPISANEQHFQGLLNEDESEHLENIDSIGDVRSDVERMPEETKENDNFEDEQSNKFDYQESSNHEKQEMRNQSSSEEKMVEEKKPPKIPTEPYKQQPPPQMPYDHYMAKPQEPPATRPPYMMDNRPPPPPSNMSNMYPPQASQMRPGYPPGYPPNPYGNYPMGPYPGMQGMQGMAPPNMAPGMNNPYYYNYYQSAMPPGMPGMSGMWNPNNRPFPNMKPMGPGGADENQSQHSEDSDSEKKREKKRSKKEKKKKKKSSSRERSRDKERERDRERSRDKSKSKSKSRRK